MRRLRRDLRRARQVQRSLLPQIPRDLPRLRMAVEYHPAYEVGGDLYQWLWPNRRQFACIVGDVCGKGIAAALLMSHLTAEFLSAAGKQPRPSRVLQILNRRMSELDQPEAFVTALCLLLEPDEQRLTIANAGHPPALGARGDGEIEWLGAASGAPLGAVEDEQYEDRSYELRERDVLLVLTDGITEALEAAGKDPTVRLRALARETPSDPLALASKLYAEVREERFDDSTIVALQLRK